MAISQTYYFIIILCFFEFCNSQSIICTNNSPKQYFNSPTLARCNFRYSNNTRPKKYEVFKSNTIEYISKAWLCKKFVSEVTLYTDLSGYEHLVEKKIDNKGIDIRECEEMIKSKFCVFGSLKKGEHSYHTNNKVTIEYPNRFTSLVKPKTYAKENCILVETKVFTHHGKKHPVNVLVDMKNCNYLAGKCQIKPNEIMIWEVNKNLSCEYISMGVFNGYFNDDPSLSNFWYNSDMQIALNLIDKNYQDCGNTLRLSSEGYALKAIKQKRLKRSNNYVNPNQEAGELQYLENNVEDHMRHLTKSFCQMFNDHNEVLEILIKENPKKYIQKSLNYSAINVKPINESIIEVQFCKQINNSEIEFTELSDINGHIPIKIKKYGDKIWYLKNGVITNEINLESDSNISDIKNIDAKRNYDLEFLNDRLIFKEHIFDDMKTNIEEELIKEMKQISNVDIELEENEQNSNIPHEIIADIESVFESYYLKYWRIYVTIAATLVYIVMVRSVVYILSPLFSIHLKSKSRKNTDKKPNTKFESVRMSELLKNEDNDTTNENLESDEHKKTIFPSTDSL